MLALNRKLSSNPPTKLTQENQQVIVIFNSIMCGFEQPVIGQSYRF